MVTSFETDAYAGITARAGIAFDRLLLYARGGVAFVGAEAEASGECGEPWCGGGALEAREDDILFGEALGGGLEYAFARNWTAGAEYRFIHLFDDLQPAGGPDPARLYWQNVRTEGLHFLRAQVSYRW